MPYKGMVSNDKPDPKSDAVKGGGPLSPKGDAPSGDKVQVTRNASGRVKFDERGNAVWEWAVTTGVFGREASTSRLRKLEDSALSLAEEAPTPALDLKSHPIAKPNPKGVAQGYSPYDSGVLAKSGAPPKKDLRRLSEWLKLRKQASNNNQDED